MTISKIKLPEFFIFFLICGLLNSLTSAMACLVFGMIFVIPLLPFVCVPCWLIGGIIGWKTSDCVNTLAIKTYLATIVVFTILSYVLIYFLFCSDFPKNLFWTLIASFVFSATAYPITLYINKKLKDPKFSESLYRTPLNP